MRRRAAAWMAVLLWCGVIFAIASIPKLRFFEETWLDWVVRKSGHMVVFGILARLAARAFAESFAWPKKKIHRAALLFTVLYAVSDEYHQSFVIGRGASPRDVAIDALGALIALALRS